MRALKIVSVIVIGVWMAWITWRIEQIRYIATQACGLAFAANERIGNKVTHPAPCPFIDFVAPAQNSK